MSVSTAILFGCAHNHDHQHESANNHNHQPGENCDLHATDPHEEEADHQDEIIFPAEQAARTDFEVQAVKESNFTSVIHCSGEITASPDDQKFLSSPVSGIVVFSGKNPAEGMPVKAGETLFYISTRGLATGDAVVKARAAYEKLSRRPAAFYKNCAKLLHCAQFKNGVIFCPFPVLLPPIRIFASSCAPQAATGATPSISSAATASAP